MRAAFRVVARLGGGEIFWRADVLVRPLHAQNGGRGRPPSNKFSS